MASCSSHGLHFAGPVAGRLGACRHACRLIERPLTAAATLARRGSFPPLLVSSSQQLANDDYSAAAAASGTTGFASTVAAAASRGVGRGSPAGNTDPRLRRWRSFSSGTGGRSGGGGDCGSSSSRGRGLRSCAQGGGDPRQRPAGPGDGGGLDGGRRSGNSFDDASSVPEAHPFTWAGGVFTSADPGLLQDLQLQQGQEDGEEQLAAGCDVRVFAAGAPAEGLAGSVSAASPEVGSCVLRCAGLASVLCLASGEAALVAVVRKGRGGQRPPELWAAPARSGQGGLGQQLASKEQSGSSAWGVGGLASAPIAIATAGLEARERQSGAGGSDASSRGSGRGSSRPAPAAVTTLIDTSSSTGNSTAMEATMRLDACGVWIGLGALQQVYGPERLDDIRRSLRERPYDQPIALFDAQEGRIMARYRGALRGHVPDSTCKGPPSPRLKIYDRTDAPLLWSAYLFARLLQLRPGALLRLRGFDTDGHTLVVELVSAGGQVSGGGGSGIPAAVRLASSGSWRGKAATNGAIGEETLREMERLIADTGRPYPLTIAVLDPDTSVVTDRYSGTLGLKISTTCAAPLISCAKLNRHQRLQPGDELLLRRYDGASRTLEVTVLRRSRGSSRERPAAVYTCSEGAGTAAGAKAAGTEAPPPPPLHAGSAAASPSRSSAGGGPPPPQHSTTATDRQRQVAAAAGRTTGVVPAATAAAAAGPATASGAGALELQAAAPAAAAAAMLKVQEVHPCAGGSVNSGPGAAAVTTLIDTSSSTGNSLAQQLTMRMDNNYDWIGLGALQQVYGPERLDDIRRSLRERPYDQPIALFDAQEGTITARFRGALRGHVPDRTTKGPPCPRLKIYDRTHGSSFARRLQLRPGAALRLRGFDTDGHTLVVELVSAGEQGSNSNSTSNNNSASNSSSASNSNSASSSSSTGGGGGIPAAVRLTSNGTCWGKAALTGAIGKERLSEIQHLVTNTGRPYPLTIAVVDPDTGAITDQFSGSLCLHRPGAHTWYISCSKLNQRLGLGKGSRLQLKGYDETSRTLEVTVLMRGGRSDSDSDSEAERAAAIETVVSGPAAGVTAAATHQQAPPPPPPPMVSTSAATSPSPGGVGSDGALQHPMAIADHQWQAATAGPDASRGGGGAVPVATSAAAAAPARSPPAAPDRLAPPPPPRGYVEPAAAQLPPPQQGPGGMGHGHAIAAPAPAAAVTPGLGDTGETVEAGYATSWDGVGGSSGSGGAAAATPPAVVAAEQRGGKRAEEEDDGGERRAAEGGAAGSLSAGSGPLPSQQSAPDPLAELLAALRGVEAARAEADAAAAAAAAAASAAAAAAEAAQAAVDAATAEAEVKAAAYLAAVAAARSVGGQARKRRAED